MNLKICANVNIPCFYANSRSIIKIRYTYFMMEKVPRNAIKMYKSLIVKILYNHHGITVAEKAIFLLNGNIVSFHN